MTLEKKKKTLILTVIAAVIAVVITIVTIAVNSVYVFIGGEAIRKDSTRVEIGLLNNRKIGRDLKKLDRFSEMNDLWMTKISDKNTKYIPEIESLESLSFAYSEIKDMAFLDNFENVEELRLFQSATDFEMLPEDALIETLDLMSSSSRNFKNAGKCKAIKKLKIYQSDLNGKCEGFIPENFISKELDSSILSDFDYVESVEISNMSIPDISGFLEMKSLKSLTIKRYKLDEPPITEEQADELRKAGIDLTLDNEKFS